MLVVCMNGRIPSPVCAFDEYRRDEEITILRALILVDLGVFPPWVFCIRQIFGVFSCLDSLLVITSCTVAVSINHQRLTGQNLVLASSRVSYIEGLTLKRSPPIFLRGACLHSIHPRRAPERVEVDTRRRRLPETTVAPQIDAKLDENTC